METRDDEVTRTMNFLASAGPYANTALSNQDANELVIRTGGSIFGRGVLYNIVCKPVSPGACKVTLERAN